MLRANVSSVLPPKFRDSSLHSAGTGMFLHPIPFPSNAGITLEPT